MYVAKMLDCHFLGKLAHPGAQSPKLPCPVYRPPHNVTLDRKHPHSVVHFIARLLVTILN